MVFNIKWIYIKVFDFVVEYINVGNERFLER